MLSALALYAVRFGAWLLNRASGCPVVVTLDVRDLEDEDFGGWLMSRHYGFPSEVVEG